MIKTKRKNNKKIKKKYLLLTAAEETFWAALVASSLGELGGRFEVLAVDILYINGFLMCLCVCALLKKF